MRSSASFPSARAVSRTMRWNCRKVGPTGTMRSFITSSCSSRWSGSASRCASRALRAVVVGSASI
jgi:hypothetical protein